MDQPAAVPPDAPALPGAPNGPAAHGTDLLADAAREADSAHPARLDRADSHPSLTEILGRRDDSAARAERGTEPGSEPAALVLRRLGDSPGAQRFFARTRMQLPEPVRRQVWVAEQANAGDDDASWRDRLFTVDPITAVQAGIAAASFVMDLYAKWERQTWEKDVSRAIAALAQAVDEIALQVAGLYDYVREETKRNTVREHAGQLQTLYLRLVRLIDAAPQDGQGRPLLDADRKKLLSDAFVPIVASTGVVANWRDYGFTGYAAVYTSAAAQLLLLAVLRSFTRRDARDALEPAIEYFKAALSTMPGSLATGAAEARARLAAAQANVDGFPKTGSIGKSTSGFTRLFRFDGPGDREPRLPAPTVWVYFDIAGDRDNGFSPAAGYRTGGGGEPNPPLYPQDEARGISFGREFSLDTRRAGVMQLLEERRRPYLTERDRSHAMDVHPAAAAQMLAILQDWYARLGPN